MTKACMSTPEMPVRLHSLVRKRPSKSREQTSVREMGFQTLK